MRDGGAYKSTLHRHVLVTKTIRVCNTTDTNMQKRDVFRHFPNVSSSLLHTWQLESRKQSASGLQYSNLDVACVSMSSSWPSKQANHECMLRRVVVASIFSVRSNRQEGVKIPLRIAKHLHEPVIPSSMYRSEMECRPGTESWHAKRLRKLKNNLLWKQTK
jgi:hypothetical protein